MHFQKKMLIVACVFSTLIGILTAFNAWSINEVATDAFDAGKDEDDDSNKEYHIVGTANAIRGVNIAFCVISIICMILCIYFTFHVEKIKEKVEAETNK